MSSNQLTITDTGLTNINRKIINDRKFADSLIQVKGDLPLTGSLISDFAKDNYLYKDGLLIDSDKVSIVIDGIYFTSKEGHDQVAWYWSNAEKTKIIKFQFVSNKPQVVLTEGGTSTTVSFDYLPLTDEMYFKVIVNLASTTCDVILEIENDIFKESRTLPIAIDLSEYTNIYIGNDPTQTEAEDNYFWEGSLNLTGFSIYDNDRTFYTPTTGYSLNITSLVISDGSITLPQQPMSVFRHMYTYDIDKPIIRSDNTLLITSQLNEESKLVIKEVGLYAENNGETYLFGYLKGLNIDKSTGVPYDLILTVNLLLSVVNVVGFPDANSFILNIIKPALLKDYIKVRNVNAYLIENLERIIRMNSLQPLSTEGYCDRTQVVTENEDGSYNIEYEGGTKCCDNPTTIQSIGYNTPQIVYREQKKISEQQDCYSSTQTYAKLYKNIRVKTKRVLNPNSINCTTSIDKSGIVTDTTGYDMFMPNVIDMTKDFEINASFTINDYASAEEGARYLISLINIQYSDPSDSASVSNVNPYLYLYIGTDNKLYATSEGTDTEIGRLSLNKKYKIKLSYDKSDRTSIDILLTEGEHSSPAVTITTPELDSLTMYMCTYCTWTLPDLETEEGGFAYNNPFLKGEIDLKEWDMIQEDNNWIPYINEVVENAQLLQYYHVPDYSKLSYTLHDICNPEYTLDILENTITGNGDLIDFESNEDFSLCVKIDLRDDTVEIKDSSEEIEYPVVTVKPIIAKVNNNILFKLELIKTENKVVDETVTRIIATYELRFTLNTTKEPVIFSLPISAIGISEYTNNPILITIIKDKFNIRIYRNNELAMSNEYAIVPMYGWVYTYIDETDPETPVTMTKTVYTLTETLEEDTTLYDSDFNVVEQSANEFHIVQEGDEYVVQYGETLAPLTPEAQTQGPISLILPSYADSHITNTLGEADNIGRYIKEIIAMSGTLTKDELYYITNLTDTNFRFTNVENKISTENISEN